MPQEQIGDEKVHGNELTYPPDERLSHSSISPRSEHVPVCEQKYAAHCGCPLMVICGHMRRQPQQEDLNGQKKSECISINRRIEAFALITTERLK